MSPTPIRNLNVLFLDIISCSAIRNRPAFRVFSHGLIWGLPLQTLGEFTCGLPVITPGRSTTKISFHWSLSTMAKNPSFFDVSEPNTRKRAPAPHMRKSCQFCRSRKTRCSGGLICNACHSRNISCVYGRESQKGRPRTSATESNPFGRSFARKLNEKGNDDCGSSYSSESARSAPSSSPAARTPQENLFADLDLQQINPGCGFPSNTSRTECPLFNETSSIGIGLQRTFKRAFGLNLDLRTPAANERCTLQALNPKPPDRFPTHLLSNSKQC